MKTPLIANEDYAADNGTAVTRIDNAYNLLRGAIAFFDYAGDLIPDSVGGPGNITGDTVNAVVGLGDGKMININDITRDTFRYNKTLPKAKTLKKMTVGGDGTNFSLNLPSTIPSGAVATIHVYNTTQLNDTMTYKEYIVPVAVGASALEIITAVIASVNADDKCIVTASAVSTDKGISFTAKSKYGFNFAVTTGGVLANTDILEYNLVNHKYQSYTTNVVPYAVGNGLPDQVRAAEDYFFATRGDGNYDNAANDNLYVKDYLTDNAKTYAQYNCTYYLDAYPLKKSDNYINELTIYVDSSNSTLIIALDHVLSAL